MSHTTNRTTTATTVTPTPENLRNPARPIHVLFMSYSWRTHIGMPFAVASGMREVDQMALYAKRPKQIVNYATVTDRNTGVRFS